MVINNLVNNACILHKSEAFIGKASEGEVVDLYFESSGPPWRDSIWKPPARLLGEIL
jgi:hypothetical protein